MGAYIPPFTIDNEIVSLVSSIMELVGKINDYQALDRLPKLRKQNRIRSIQSSCAIEANSLSLAQVGDIVNGIKVIGPEKDILEVKNAIAAYETIETIDPYSEKDLLRIHGIMTDHVIHESGKYRNGEEGVFDGDKCIFVAPPSKNVPLLMRDLFTWLDESRTVLHPLILSSVFHYEFVFIHPFSDGNGRMARLWQSAILGKWKPFFYCLPIENQIKDHQEDYYKAIAKCHSNGNSDAFIVFMLSMIRRTLIGSSKDAEMRFAHLNSYVTKLLSKMEPGIPYSANEILILLHLRSKETLRAHYLNSAIEDGLVELEHPDKPTSKNQRYIKK